jgi:hypothetical protein
MRNQLFVSTLSPQCFRFFCKLLRSNQLKTFLIFLVFTIGIGLSTVQAQILKRVKDAAKYKVEQKAETTAANATEKAMDKVVEEVKKPKQTKSSKTKSQEGEPAPAMEAKPASNKKEEDGNSSVEIKASANEIFITGKITLTGRSIKYEGYAAVQIKVTGPKNHQESYDVTMRNDGSFSAIWAAPAETGKYYIKAISSDKKSDTTISIEVIMLDELDAMADENIAATEKAKAIIESRVQAVKSSLNATQRSELETKKKKATDNLDKMLKLFGSINGANKQLGSVVSKGSVLPPNLSSNLSQLNDNLKQQAADIKKANEEFQNHTATENTICEYLVMINEACAAFSTAVGFYSKSISTVLKNIVLDKGPGVAVDAGTAKIGWSPPTGTDIIPKELGKLYATSKLDAESLTGNLGLASFAGDMMSYVSDILLKTYCGLYSGEMTQNFEFTYRNNFGDVWWKYGGTLKAAVNLRYPKSNLGGGAIKMKGNLEGNAIKFTFFADPKEAVAEEMKSSYNFTKLITLADIKAPAVPFGSATVDKAGFGAVARSAATPASFYIPIDAEYDVQSGQIKLFINEALLDFTPLIKNKKVYILMGPLPLFRWNDFPIEKAQRIIRGSLKDKNIFTVTGANAGTPQFNGTINRKVETKEYTINLSITMNVKKN